MEFLPLADWHKRLCSLQQSLNASVCSERERSLRCQSQKKLREMWQAYMFGWCYERAFELPPISMQMVEKEDDDCDAMFGWYSADSLVTFEIQLKELPPIDLNKGGETVQGLVDKAALKYQRSPNLVLVIFVNQSDTYENVRIPRQGLGGFWLFWFDEQGSKMFLKGCDRFRGERRVSVQSKTSIVQSLA